MYGLRPRTAGQGPHGPGESARILTPDVFGTIRKRRKVLPSTALKSNSAHTLFALAKPYRFFCSTSNQWVIADEVAYDEKHGTFQSVREYQRVIRPRNGVKQEINLWPQLGVERIEYQDPSKASAAAPWKNASAFVPQIPTHEEEQEPAPSTMPPPIPASQLPPGSMLPPSGMAPPAFQQPTYQQYDPTAMPPVMSDTMSETSRLFDSTTVGEGSTAYDGATQRGDASSMFDATETQASQSYYDGQTERGSVVDPNEMPGFQREDRAQRVATAAGVEKHRAQSALNEYDAMESLPKRGTKAYSTWLTEFSGKHGFKPDIITALYPK